MYTKDLNWTIRCGSNPFCATSFQVAFLPCDRRPEVLDSRTRALLLLKLAENYKLCMTKYYLLIYG